MANINSVFISIDIYSSSLDKMILKTNQAVNKLMVASALTDSAASKMLIASATMDKVFNKMLKISKETEKATDKLLKVGEATGKVIEKMVSVGTASDKASDKIEEAGKSSEEASKDMDDASKNTKKMNKELEKTEKSAKKSVDGIKVLTGALGKIKKLQKVFNLADNLAIKNTKLDAVNDGPKGTLTDKVFEAAGNSRSSFSNMAGYVSALEGIQGSLFTSNDESLAFAQLAQRSFVAGGATTEESKSSMNKLIESMSKGNLSGDDLTSISQSAPVIYEAIATYTGKSGEELQKLASQGQLRATDIKNAMFSMSGEINEKFAQTPMTFSDVWTRVKDGGLQAFSGILEKITELISSPGFMQFIDTVVFGFGMIADGVANFIGMIVNGWDIIAPILGMVGTVLLAGIIGSLVAMIPPMLTQIGLWLGMALPVLAVAAAIGIVIAIVRGFGATWEEIFGFIGGVIGTFVGAFYNNFVVIWNVIAAFINFFGNSFNDSVASIKILILDLLINFMTAIEYMAKGISDLVGLLGIDLNIVGDFTGMKESFMKDRADIMNGFEYKTFMESKQMVDLTDAAKKGSDIGSQLPSTASEVVNDLQISMTKDPNGKDPAHAYSQYTAPTVNPISDPGIINNPVTGSMDPVAVKGTGQGGSIPVEMPDEDLDYLREIAERDYIANVATNSLAPSIAIQFGDVHETADANKVAGRIRKILQEEIAMVSEGVY